MAEQPQLDTVLLSGEQTATRVSAEVAQPNGKDLG